ncbi:MAG: hypothetical protein R3F34_16405 [Planctomycetota bacterium]
MGSRRERKLRQQREHRDVDAVVRADGLTDAPSLADLAADALDFAAVVAHLAPLAASALGRRAVEELSPRDDDGARGGGAPRRAARARGRRAADERPRRPGARLRDASRYSRVLSAEDLVKLLAFLTASNRLAAWLAERRDRAPELAKLADGLPKLESLEQKLLRGIDRRGEVRDDASQRLSNLRRAQAELVQRIEKKMRAIANRPDLRNALAPGQTGTVHLRDERAVLAVRAKALGRIQGIVHDHSGSGETAFVEPAEVVELGNELATVRADAEREVHRLLVEWTVAAVERLDRIERVAARMAEVELALVGKRLCERLGARPLEIATTSEGLVLRGARHPLLAWQVQEGTLPRCVPIDLRLGDPFRVLVITGPNTGGKTLALKTAGLAVLMARCGMPFPCEAGSRVPLHRAIVADIGDAQAVEQNLSTFSSSLVRIAKGLERAGPRTLYLLDELGGGTDPADGAALGAALLEWLLERQAPTIASTHIGRLKEFGFAHAGAENASVEFDVETLLPTYKLVVGAPGESRALVIARRLGLPHEILERAEGLVDRSAEESMRLMGDIQNARLEAERKREDAAARLAEVDERSAELERARADLAAKSDRVLDEAEIEVNRRLLGVRDALDALRRVAPQVGGAARAELDRVVASLDAAATGAALGERRRAFVDKLRKGDFVYLPRHKKRCQVLKVDRERGILRVKLGRVELELALDEATPFESL